MRAHPSVMADAAKKEKIAAAKKKLKQFQQKKTGQAPSSSPATKQNTRGKLNGTNGNTSNSRSASSSPLRPSTPVRRGVVDNDSTNKSPNPTGNLSMNNQSTYSTPVGNSQPLPSKVAASASTEKLQQLSRQINGLITDSSAYLNDELATENRSLAELEARNRELASLLQQHSQVNEQLNKQLQELKSHNSKLQASLDGERKGSDDRTKRDVGALKEQLQVHIQTIGILVAEKTELQSALNQSQKQSETRSQEIDELQGRLKASRTRVADLERSFTSASSSSQKLEKSSKELSKEVDRLKLELYKSNKLTEELQQKSTELAGKLQTKSAECGRAEDSLIELKGKLEMAELHVEQLKNGGVSVVDQSDEVDRLLTERNQLQGKVDQYEETFQRLSAERDQLSAQYQQYIDQISAQNQQLQLQITAVAEERDKLQRQQGDLEASFSELQSKQDSATAVSSEIENEKQELSQNLIKLQGDFNALKAHYDAQVADNSQLSSMVSEKEAKIEEMELTMQRLSDSSVDREQLLEAMQSDKTALSRAMAQNKELKHQLAELQNGFVKMSNDNMDLMTQLTSEQHVAKELAQRLSQQEDELKDTREQLADRDRQVRQMEGDTSVLRTQHFTNEQVEDRLRHYEAQAQLVETLQRELNSAQDTINALTNQNSHLHSRIAASENGTTENGTSDQSDMINSLSTSVQQLEMERNQVVKQMEEEKERAESAQSKLQQLQNELAHQTPATLNGDVISKAQFEALQHAMKQLEEKYTRTMRDKADLSDKTDQLEHLIMQLQGETDTIGEYVTLYQHQRSVLRQRAVEKDDYIARLSREREQMQDKFTQLQTLVMQLLGERKIPHGADMLAAAQGAPNASVPAGKTASPGSDGKRKKRFGTTLDSSNLEDWPDYTSESDSEASEVEEIVGGSPSTAEGTAATTIPSTSTADAPGHSKQQQQQQQQPATPTHHVSASPDSAKADWGVPSDPTAQRIMHLLTEIGNTTRADGPAGLVSATRNLIHCSHCTGRLLNL